MNSQSNLQYPPKALRNKSTSAIVAYIREFNRLNGLKGGSVYTINGKEVTV